jgi:hypothetical protein
VQNRYYKLAILAAVSALFSNTAWAGPPANCACKFVGVWKHSAGNTTINADGTAKPDCTVPCVAIQTWTCEGDTIIMRNPGEFTGTLVDANHIQGAGWTSTRDSGGACAPSPKKPPAAERCARPAPGQVTRTNDGICVVASNTNTLPRCKYSFTYISSIKNERLGGGVVDPGKTGRVCTSRPGEALRFDSWHETAETAR